MKIVRFALSAPIRQITLILLVLLGFTVSWVGFPNGHTSLLVFSVLGGLPTIWGGLRSIWEEHRISIDTFNMLGLLLAYGMLDASSAGFIVLMLQSASLLEWNTRCHASRAVSELLALRPEHATVEGINGVLQEVSIEDVHAGSVVLVREGERIPVDGVIISGSASIDASSMTGESALQNKSFGDDVLGITVVVEGHLRVRATTVGKESTVSRMIKIVESAEKNKSKTHLMADRFAQIFLPLVVLGGIGVFLFTHDVTMVIAFFLVACADDIAVSIPLAFSAALGQAARNGIIIKGGKWLEALARVKTFVLDKTGTLTYGTFSVREAYIESGVNESIFWRSVAGIERYSAHPIGKALYRDAQQKYDGKELPEAEDIVTYDGAGIIGRVNGVRVAVGDEDIVEASGLEMQESVYQKFLKKKEQNEMTTLFVFLDNVFSGFITIADAPKEDARKDIEALRGEGIERIIMLTGDTESTARDVANTLGISEFRYGLRPEDKVMEVENALKNGDVAMVGDGVNDAPVLARSSVGIAMGIRGTAIAIESADIVLLEDDLGRLSYLVRLGRKTLSVVRWNVVIWVITNLVGFVLVLVGVLDPALAALYNFITDFLPLINSGRLFIKKVE